MSAASAASPAATPKLSDQQRKELSSQAKAEMEEARTSLVLTRPFFATLSLARPLVEDWTCKTAWTDGRRIGYNPEFVCKQDSDQLKGLLAHEVWHIAFAHHLRREWRDPKQWNIATDATINRMVLADNFALPDGGIPPAATDDYAEDLYQEPPPGDGGAGGADPGNCVEVREPTNDDGSSLTDAQVEVEAQQGREDLNRAINIAKMAGKLPAGLDRAVEAAKPRVPWKDVLAEFMSQFARNDYSFERVDRRMVGAGFVFPSLYSEEHGRVVFTADTSASQDMEAVQKCAGEVLALCEELSTGGEAELTVAWWDTALYLQVITDKSEIKPQGGGGTSTVELFDWVAGRSTKKYAIEAGECVAVVAMTDGHIWNSSFGEDPGVPVIWILTAPNRAFKPPVGRVAWTFDE